VSAVPVTVVGGYLGAGKTTLVNHLLRHARGLRLAVLVNDFGELPIDADLIEAADDDVISLAGGCVCCSFGSDLMAALAKLGERTPRPEHVLIETSGVALPGAVARALTLTARFAVDGVLVLADAETLPARAADRYMGDTIARQLADADLVVLNKMDLVAPAALSALRATLGDKRTVDAVHARVPIDVVLGAGPSGEAPSWREVSAPIDDAAARYDRAIVTPAGPIDVTALARALTAPGLGIIRAKGVLADGDGSVKTLHVVGSRGAVRTAETSGSLRGLVCIGRRGELDRGAIEAAVTARETRRR
jgi:G3E family GTPase